MDEKPGNSELGAARGTYPTNNRRRGWVAAILLLAGVPVTVLAVVFWVVVEDRSGKVRTAGDPLLLPSVAVGLGLGMLLVGVWAGIWFLSRRGEVFELHDNGLRYSRADRSRIITWADVDRVVVNHGKNTALARWVGGDLNCAIHLSGGGKVSITGLTKDARQLARHVENATAR
ncbi:hypothetical protein [Crossiella sp. NPDC003009]